jgi:hypothetical protein
MVGHAHRHPAAPANDIAQERKRSKSCSMQHRERNSTESTRMRTWSGVRGTRLSHRPCAYGQALCIQSPRTFGGGVRGGVITWKTRKHRSRRPCTPCLGKEMYTYLIFATDTQRGHPTSSKNLQSIPSYSKQALTRHAVCTADR